MSNLKESFHIRATRGDFVRALRLVLQIVGPWDQKLRLDTEWQMMDLDTGGSISSPGSEPISYAVVCPAQQEGSYDSYIVAFYVAENTITGLLWVRAVRVDPFDNDIYDRIMTEIDKVYPEAGILSSSIRTLPSQVVGGDMDTEVVDDVSLSTGSWTPKPTDFILPVVHADIERLVTALIETTGWKFLRIDDEEPEYYEELAAGIDSEIVIQQPVGPPDAELYDYYMHIDILPIINRQDAVKSLVRVWHHDTQNGGHFSQELVRWIDETWPGSRRTIEDKGNEPITHHDADDLEQGTTGGGGSVQPSNIEEDHKIDPRDIRCKPYMYHIPLPLSKLESWLLDFVVDGCVVRHEGKLVPCFHVRREVWHDGKIDLHIEHFQSDELEYGVPFRDRHGTMGKLTLIELGGNCELRARFYWPYGFRLAEDKTWLDALDSKIVELWPRSRMYADKEVKPIPPAQIDRAVEATQAPTRTTRPGPKSPAEHEWAREQKYFAAATPEEIRPEWEQLRDLRLNREFARRSISQDDYDHRMKGGEDRDRIFREALDKSPTRTKEQWQKSPNFWRDQMRNGN